MIDWDHRSIELYHWIGLLLIDGPALIQREQSTQLLMVRGARTREGDGDRCDAPVPVAA